MLTNHLLMYFAFGSKGFQNPVNDLLPSDSTVFGLGSKKEKRNRESEREKERNKWYVLKMFF